MRGSPGLSARKVSSALPGLHPEIGSCVSSEMGTIKAARNAPGIGLLVAFGFGFGGGHPDGQRPVGNVMGVWPGGNDWRDTAR